MAYWKFRKPGRAKLTVLSRLAAIQIELTIVMRREGSGRRWTADDSDRGNKSNSGGDDSFDFRFDRVWELKAWLKNVPHNYSYSAVYNYISSRCIGKNLYAFDCEHWMERETIDGDNP